MLYDDEAVCNADAEPPAGDFYETVDNGGRRAYLLGPYADIREAIANSHRARELASERDPWAWGYVFGTQRVAPGTPVRTVFGS